MCVVCAGVAQDLGLAIRRQRRMCIRDRLHTVSPQATLQRGYAIVTRGSGQSTEKSLDIVQDAGSLKPGEQVIARLHHGQFQATVTHVTEHDNSEEKLP